MPMSRAEHIRWCKERAHREADYALQKDPADLVGAARGAMASMGSDLSKHAETNGMQSMAMLLGMAMLERPTKEQINKYIDGFAE